MKNVFTHVITHINVINTANNSREEISISPQPK